MTPAEKQALKVRARALLSAPVPDSVRIGSAVRAAQYRDDAAVIATFVLRGINAEKTLLALLRMESMQQTRAAAAGTRSGPAAAAPAVHTPSSNTGVNDASSGNGRGLERGYLAAAARVQMSFATARGLA